jgi:carbamoyl-phosphate synthase small subunit
VVLSNGPGDPVDVPWAVQLARELIGELPVLGICLGHQILGQAAGFKTYKLPFGHHGGNHPVADVKDRAVWITSQNHNYCVEFPSGGSKDWSQTLVNLNDQTVEGFRHRELPVMAVQFHPEAGPGPHDAFRLFPDFLEAVRGGGARVARP